MASAGGEEQVTWKWFFGQIFTSWLAHLTGDKQGESDGFRNTHQDNGCTVQIQHQGEGQGGTSIQHLLGT